MVVVLPVNPVDLPVELAFPLEQEAARVPE
jgi:hypothetical protein